MSPLASRHPDFLRAILPTVRDQADRLRRASAHPHAAVLRRQYDAILQQVAEIEATIAAGASTREATR